MLESIFPISLLPAGNIPEVHAAAVIFHVMILMPIWFLLSAAYYPRFFRTFWAFVISWLIFFFTWWYLVSPFSWDQIEGGSGNVAMGGIFLLLVLILGFFLFVAFVLDFLSVLDPAASPRIRIKWFYYLLMFICIAWWVYIFISSTIYILFR